MTATLEQTQSDLARLVSLAQQGEDVVITSDGRIVARLTGVPPAKPSPGRRAWLAKLARLRESTATGRASPTTEEILDDLRSDNAEEGRPRGAFRVRDRLPHESEKPGV